MKVLIVNTSEKTGGAALAASRLTEALINNGVSAKMLVMEKESDNIFVASIGGWLKKSWNFAFERLVIWVNNLFSRNNLFTVSIANTGIDIIVSSPFSDPSVDPSLNFLLALTICEC